MVSLNATALSAYPDGMRTRENPVLPKEAAAELKATASSIAKRVRAWRLFFDQSQEDVARAANLSTVLVRSIEGGRRLPTLNALSRLALVFGITAESLMFSDPPRKD